MQQPGDFRGGVDLLPAERLKSGQEYTPGFRTFSLS
jgi:hypothetical protein